MAAVVARRCSVHSVARPVMAPFPKRFRTVLYALALTTLFVQAFWNVSDKSSYEVDISAARRFSQTVTAEDALY